MHIKRQTASMSVMSLVVMSMVVVSMVVMWMVIVDDYCGAGVRVMVVVMFSMMVPVLYDDRSVVPSVVVAMVVLVALVALLAHSPHFLSFKNKYEHSQSI